MGQAIFFGEEKHQRRAPGLISISCASSGALRMSATRASNGAADMPAKAVVQSEGVGVGVCKEEEGAGV